MLREERAVRGRSGRRRRSERPQAEPDLYREIGGVVLAAAGVWLYITMAGGGGWLGERVRTGLVFVVGTASGWVLPGLLLALGIVRLILHRWVAVPPSRLVGGAVLFLTLVTMIQAYRFPVLPDAPQAAQAAQRVAHFDLQSLSRGGGAVGWGLEWLLTKLLGTAGRWVALVAAGLVGMVLAFEVSLGRMLNRAGDRAVQAGGALAAGAGRLVTGVGRSRSDAAVRPAGVRPDAVHSLTGRRRGAAPSPGDEEVAAAAPGGEAATTIGSASAPDGFGGAGGDRGDDDAPGFTIRIAGENGPQAGGRSAVSGAGSPAGRRGAGSAAGAALGTAAEVAGAAPGGQVGVPPGAAAGAAAGAATGSAGAQVPASGSPGSGGTPTRKSGPAAAGALPEAETTGAETPEAGVEEAGIGPAAAGAGPAAAGAGPATSGPAAVARSRRDAAGGAAAGDADAPTPAAPGREGPAGSRAPGAAAGPPMRLARQGEHWQMALDPSAPPEPLPYQLPPLDLLKSGADGAMNRDSHKAIVERAKLLEEVLETYGVPAKVIEVHQGPAITRFELTLKPGVKIAKVANLADDLAYHLAARDVRIEAPIPGKRAIGIEVPNEEVVPVHLRDVLESEAWQRQKSRLAVGFGKDIAGQPIVGDLAKMPHLLIAGATGSGKSVCLNGIICSLLMRAQPNEVKMLMVDPKRVELSVYDGIPHLVAPVVTDPRKAAGYLKWAVKEMEARYDLLAASGTRNIEGYNRWVAEQNARAQAEWEEQQRRAATSAGGAGTAGAGAASRAAGPGTAAGGTGGPPGAAAAAPGSEGGESGGGEEPHLHQPLPYVVIILDELSDLMMVAPVEVEDSIIRLAQMARACGIHLVIATQRPSVDVITGLIKANIPSRVAFAVSSAVESRIILDGTGAEKLLGKGDMLYHPQGYSKPLRAQGAFVSDQEVEALVSFVKRQGEPVYQAEAMAVEGTGSKPGRGADAGNGNGGGAKGSAVEEIFPEAVKLVIEHGQASVSILQRRLRCNYTKATRLIDMMEERGFIGPHQGPKPRDVLITMPQWQALFEGEEEGEEPAGGEWA